ncbi:MAG: amino acid/amide transporter ATP-binding protein 2, family [Deltaproteobacteria bacterium]|jgi:branched-chain amino acid transport system ATP-binding protein|nr:amino acid/amide transporter ATP-binding protein 2, family [Deltaproteobacteria bacterium]
MLIDIKNLTVNYSHVPAVTGVNIDLEEKAIGALIGANGAGKSTILKTISGLLTPASGEIWYRGERLDGLPPHQIVRRGIVHVPEGRRVFPYLPVLANIRLGAYLRRRDRKAVDNDLERVFFRFPRLKERRKQQAGTLSGGEQQMLAIARGLLAKPALLLLDEPSLGLAPIIVQEIARIILNINKQDGVGIILVEQNSYMALSLADKGYVLEAGRLSLQGNPKELLSNEHVKKAYLGG